MVFFKCCLGGKGGGGGGGGAFIRDGATNGGNTVYIYIYIYIERERERERESGGGRKKGGWNSQRSLKNECFKEENIN